MLICLCSTYCIVGLPSLTASTTFAPSCHNGVRVLDSHFCHFGFVLFVVRSAVCCAAAAAAVQGDVEGVRRCLLADYNVNEADELGCTPVHLAGAMVSL